MQKRALGLAAVVLSGTIVLAACGDDDDSGSAATTAAAGSTAAAATTAAAASTTEAPATTASAATSADDRRSRARHSRRRTTRRSGGDPRRLGRHDRLPLRARWHVDDERGARRHQGELAARDRSLVTLSPGPESMPRSSPSRRNPTAAQQLAYNGHLLYRSPTTRRREMRTVRTSATSGTCFRPPASRSAS